MIRLAEIKDVHVITSMIYDQALDMNLKHVKAHFSMSKTSNLVKDSIHQGLCWVYEVDGIKGLLMAHESFSIFSETGKEIHLISIYVNKDHRKGPVGGKLLLTFDKECSKRESLQIWIGAKVGTELSTRSLAKLGYVLKEHHYLKEK